jgi:hypothetical protein
LEKALGLVWPDALMQRCTVHKHRNLLAHAPERLGTSPRPAVMRGGDVRVGLVAAVPAGEQDAHVARCQRRPGGRQISLVRHLGRIIKSVSSLSSGAGQPHHARTLRPACGFLGRDLAGLGGFLAAAGILSRLMGTVTITRMAMAAAWPFFRGRRRLRNWALSDLLTGCCPVTPSADDFPDVGPHTRCRRLHHKPKCRALFRRR